MVCNGRLNAGIATEAVTLPDIAVTLWCGCRAGYGARFHGREKTRTLAVSDIAAVPPSKECKLPDLMRETGVKNKKPAGLESAAGFPVIWCPGEDSVTQARPRLRLQAQPFSSPRKALKRFSSWADMKKGLHAQTFLVLWCPGEDSVTQARPRLRLQAQPFSSSRKALKRFSSWADMKKGLHAQTFLVLWCPGEDSNLHSVATART